MGLVVHFDRAHGRRPPIRTVIECSIDVITKLSRPGDEFTMRDIANKWRHCYKFLRIAEANGVCMQGVVLDYSAIKNWELQSSSK
jgi:hypothetical protein